MGSYYDIDAILADSQKVACTFNIEAPGLGFLAGDSNRDIQKGGQVSLPFWLAGYLAVQNFGTSGPLMSMELPASVSDRVLNALKANPKTVDLSYQTPYFYKLAALALELFEEDEIVEILTETFKARAAEIADHAHNSRGALGEGLDSPRGLDELEKQLFRSAHATSKAAQTWLGELRKRT